MVRRCTAWTFKPLSQHEGCIRTRSKFSLDRLYAATVGMLPVPKAANAGFAEFIYFLAPNRSPRDLSLLSLMHSSCHMEAEVVVLLQYQGTSQDEDHPPYWHTRRKKRFLTWKFVTCGVNWKSSNRWTGLPKITRQDNDIPRLGLICLVLLH